ncbi:MAG: hypothetical protein EXX96DRAFT_619094 [Benjaminiella poitrasii]|nr:MAG: hypothetical protein EXX96DRAFT_619094 [Benjaminiella poitrasii]
MKEHSVADYDNIIPLVTMDEDPAGQRLVVISLNDVQSQAGLVQSIGYPNEYKKEFNWPIKKIGDITIMISGCNTTFIHGGVSKINSDQLLDESMLLNANFNQNVATDSAHITRTTLQGLTAPINAVMQEIINIEHVNQLHNLLDRSVAQLLPYIIAIQQTITQLLQLLRQMKAQIENDIQLSLVVCQNKKGALPMSSFSQETQQTELNLEDKCSRPILISYYKNQHRSIIDANREIEQCLQMDSIKRRLQQVESQRSSLFQQAEIISQQLSLVVANPEGN